MFIDCARCRESFRVKPSYARRVRYCSKACMGVDYRTRMSGEGNPHYSAASLRRCETCRSDYHSYNKARRYCSRRCFEDAPGTRDAKRERGVALAMRGRHCRTDKNQQEVVDALQRVGAVVVSTSMLGGGFPDLLVGYGGRNFLLEVKNPKSRYGKAGLSKSQKEFAATWPDVYVVSSGEEAVRVVVEAARPR